jgi:hypothetical protein
MLKKLTLAAVAVASIAGGTLATASDAEAQRFRGRGFGAGLAVGLIGGGLLAAGAAHASPGYVVDEGPVVRCRLVDRYNVYGDYVRTIRVCRSVY